MATSREYADFILQKFSRLEGVVTIRPMMGEYVIHMAGKVLGFLGDEQLMLEPGPTIAQLLPEAEKRELFPGSKLMYIIDDSMSPHRLCEIAEAIYDDLPVSKPRKKDSRAKSAAAASKSSVSKSRSGAGAAASGAASRTNTGARKKESEKTADDIDKMFPFAKHIKW